MDHTAAIIIANTFFAASFLAEKKSAYTSIMVCGCVWLVISFFGK